MHHTGTVVVQWSWSSPAGMSHTWSVWMGCTLAAHHVLCKTHRTWCSLATPRTLSCLYAPRVWCGLSFATLSGKALLLTCLLQIIVTEGVVLPCVRSSKAD